MDSGNSERDQLLGRCEHIKFLNTLNNLPEDDTSCVETCRISLFVISTVIVIGIYVHSLVELKIKNI